MAVLNVRSKNSNAFTEFRPSRRRAPLWSKGADARASRSPVQGKLRLMPVTLKQVSHRAKVAAGTVSRVINQHPNVDPELRKRVEQAILELNYRPNARAQSFVRNSSPIVSFILSNRSFLHPLHSRILQGVESYCEEAGHFVLFTRFRYEPDTPPAELRLPGVLRSHGIADSVILAGTNYQNFVEALDEMSAKYVLLANNFVGTAPRAAVDQVRFNDDAGAFDATRHLIELGHKDIWYIGDTSLPWYNARHLAYLRAMANAGLEPRSQTVALSDDYFQNGLSSVRMILDGKRPVTAIFAGTDELAFGVWEGLRQRNLDVPRDVSLIGFDNHSGAMKLPQLTSVSVDAEEVGRQLARLAIAKLKPDCAPMPEVVIPTSLVKRETCLPLLQ